MKTILRSMILTVTAIIAMAFLSGCNTVQGLGKDMQQGGRELQKAAANHL